MPSIRPCLTTACLLLIAGGAQAHIMTALPPPPHAARGEFPILLPHYTTDSALLVTPDRILPGCTITTTIQCDAAVHAGPTIVGGPTTDTISVVF